MNQLRTFCLLLVTSLAACGAPTASTPTVMPAATSAAAVAPAVAPTSAVATTAVSVATTAAMANSSAESYGPSIAAGLPAVQPDAASFPITIENCGRKLTFTKPPERVIGLWQPSNELLLALGVQDRVVAIAGNYTALPADLAALNANIKQIGTAMAWPSKEVLLTEKPDLVLSEGLEGFSYDAAKGYATVAEIEASGAKILSTGGSCTPTDPMSQTKSTATVYNDLAMLGKVFGVSARADALISALKAKEAAVMAKVAGKPPVKVAFYNGGEGPVYVLTFGIWADLMTKAGGANVINAKGYQVSVEEFASAQPDVILVGYFPGQDPQAAIEFLKKTFPTVPAVQSNRLAPIPTIETEASVQVMDGLEKIAQALHPEAFK